jgi:ubiquinone/menaquinone biosynthesis C-methylase UbiE
MGVKSLMSVFTKLQESGAFDIDGNLYVQRGLKRPNKFEELYLQLRKKEERLYSDSELGQLPEIHKAHVHHREWQMRTSSMKRLLDCLSKGKAPRNILEVGCGNGWLSHHLAAKLSSEICALDINEHELRQGSRVFASHTNLIFLYADVLDWPADHVQFDIIVLASSAQYFPDLKVAVERLLKMLVDGGTLHILDSPFYNEGNVEAARARSLSYFQSLDHPEMAETYHHHRATDLHAFAPEVMYDPGGLMSQLERKLFRVAASSFPWYRITKGIK